MKTIRDGTHFRNVNLGRLAEALIIELTNAHVAVPPVPLLYDLDTAGMLLGMSRRELRKWLIEQHGRYQYKVNKVTKQRFLTGEDVQAIRKELIVVETPDYDARAKNLSSVQKCLAPAGTGESGDNGG